MLSVDERLSNRLFVVCEHRSIDFVSDVVPDPIRHKDSITVIEAGESHLTSDDLEFILLRDLLTLCMRTGSIKKRSLRAIGRTGMLCNF